MKIVVNYPGIDGRAAVLSESREIVVREPCRQQYPGTKLPLQLRFLGAMAMHAAAPTLAADVFDRSAP
jgi:hypothetical protein